jgi:3-oxoacyl-[acyl-carrier-protein] synthase III
MREFGRTHDILQREKESQPASLSFGIYYPQEWMKNSDAEYEKVGVRGVSRANHYETQSFMLHHAYDQIATSLPKKQDIVGVTTSYPDGTDLGRELVDTFCLQTEHIQPVYAACSGAVRFFKYLYDLNKEEDLTNKSILLGSVEKYSPTLRFGTHDAAIFSDGAVVLGGLTYGKNFEVVSAIGRKLSPENDELLQMPIDYTLATPHALIEPVPPSHTGFFEMDGPGVYKVVKRTVPQLIADTLESADMTLNDVDLIIPHQGSGRTNTGLMKAMPEVADKFVSDIENGNFSSGSVIKAFHRARREGRIHDESTVLFVGFGAGLYGAAAVIRLGV